MSEEYETFLAKRKLTADSLKEARAAAGGVTDLTPAQKMFSESQVQKLNTRVNNYPFDVQDIMRERMTMMTSMVEHTQDVCYDMCAQDNDLTFLSIKEARCFRNCVTKTGYLMPALQKSFRQAEQPSFVYQQELTEKLREKFGKPTPDLRIYEEEN